MHFEESSPSFSPESIPSRDWSGPVTPLALGQGGDGVGCEEATRRDRPFCRALTRQRDGEETLDHRVDLFGHLQLAEVPGAYGLAILDIGEHLVETCHVRARLELVGRYVDARYRQPAGASVGS